MVLAEALLRVPDAATADRLIEDKLAAGRWLDSDIKSSAILVSASAWTLGIAARVIHPGETPETILDAVIRRLGLPAMRAAARQAMRLIGSHFVLGQTIGEALERARSHSDFRYSFDMLGEGARTAADAEKYFHAYAGAIEAIGDHAGNAPLPGGRAFRLSCRRCIRATRRSRASACCASSCRGSLNSPARPLRATFSSLSMPRKRTGWNYPSTSSVQCSPIRRWPASASGRDLVSRCRPIRSARRP